MLPDSSLRESKAASVRKPLEVNDIAVIVKPGSSKFGERVTVIDPNWNGMVKVVHGGDTKSFLPDHLQRDEVSENAGLEPEEEEKADLEYGSKVGGWLTPSFILVFNSARSDTSLGFLAEGEIPGKLGMYRG